MNKRFVAVAGALLLVFLGRPAFADDTPDIFVCTNAKHAAIGAAAMKSLFLLDASALDVTTTLQQKKQCWFETISIPKKHTTLLRLYVQEGSADAYVIVPLKLRGVLRYVVYFEEGGPVIDI